jgi:hypothetical protein
MAGQKKGPAAKDQEKDGGPLSTWWVRKGLFNERLEGRI